MKTRSCEMRFASDIYRQIDDHVKHDAISQSLTMTSNIMNKPVYYHVINDDVINDLFNPKIYDDFNHMILFYCRQR